MVKIFLSIITRQAIRRGGFGSVDDPTVVSRSTLAAGRR
jgi:hypothetical protein